MKTLLSLATTLVLLAGMGFAQTKTTQTTLSAAMTASQNYVQLASTTGVNAPSGNQIQTILVIDREAMAVTAVNTTSGIATVIRGYNSTYQQAHNTSAVVWVGPSGGGATGASPFFADTNKAPATGSCVAANEPYLPRIYLPSGNVVNCIASGPSGKSVWTVQYAGTPNSFTDATFFVGPASCMGSTTGTPGTGNNTVIIDGNVPALKVSATSAGASHEVFTCNFTIPSRLTAGRGVVINDITYLYSVQTTTATSMVASTLGSFTAPVPAASETASSATLVSAGGTLVQTPAVASANLTSVSAGQYYSEKVAMGTPVAVVNDGQVFVFTFELDQSASSAQIVTTPGIYVHLTSTPL